MQSARGANDTGHWDPFIGQHCMVTIQGRSVEDDRRAISTSAEAKRRPWEYLGADERFAALPWVIGQILEGGGVGVQVGPDFLLPIRWNSTREVSSTY